MSEAKHTPGPWVVCPLPDHEWRVKAKEPKGCFTICGVTSFDAREANARLIAAAPDLLAACEAALKWVAANTPMIDDTDPVFGELAHEADDLRSTLRTAIAKAKGGAS